VKDFYFIQDIPVPAANALCKLHQIIEKATKNYGAKQVVIK
jgi:hypothetical protein